MATPAPPSPSPSSTRAPPVHKNPPFFRRPPKDWSIAEYLSYRHAPSLAPRRILDSWRKSLLDIAECTSTKCSCTDAHRLRARDLLARYAEQGNGSDRHVGQMWLRKMAPSSAVVAGADEAAAAKTIHYGPVFNAAVDSAPFSQTNYNAAAAPEPTKKRPASDEVGDDGDVDSDVPVPLPKRQAREPAPESELEPDDAVDTATEAAFDTKPIPLDPSAAKKAFAKCYAAMHDSSKWFLSSGRAVEAVIFDACQAMDDETFAASLGQSFVLDVTCATTESWFTRDEWAEVRSCVPPLPKPDPVFVESLRRFFSVKTTAELREVLRKTDYLPKDATYDPVVHFDSQWADLVVRLVLNLFEAPGEPLRAAHLEDWYTSYLWSPILDQCLLSLPGMTIERKEAPCRATSTRKNRHRKSTTGKLNRLKSGRRLDAIIRTVEDDSHEYGAMEVARTFSGTTSSKWLGDAWKLCRALRDMLYRLHELVEHDQHVAGQLQVVGVVNAGLALQVVRLASPSTCGGVCLLVRERVLSVPTGVAELRGLLRVVGMVAQMKAVVADCVGKVRGRMEGKSEEELFRELMDGPGEVGRRLFWAADTP